MAAENTKKQEKRHPSQIVKEWWGVVLIGVAILGGYWWLDENYARIEKLAAEKCVLSYEIRLTKADIEFTDTDKEGDLHRNELEDLLQRSNPPQERVNFKKKYIESLNGRLQEINKKRECLRRAKDKCFQGNTDTDQCYDITSED